MGDLLAVIPARGGSKGIPRKNLRLLAGKPLVAHTIEQALACPRIGRVVVSTDDPEIAETARRFGAEALARPPEISGDTASSESALLHVLDTLKAREGSDPPAVVFLQATSPLRGSDDILRAVETFEREGADSLFSACPQHGFVWRREGGGLRSFSYDYRSRPRRQDAPEDLRENGSIYIFKPWILRTHGNRLGGKIAAYRMHEHDSFEIDEPSDFELIELLRSARGGEAGARLEAVRLLVLDFDGVMTDNRVWVDQDGREAVLCNRSDGWGIGRLKEAGLEAMVLSTETNPVVSARCRKLGIACIQSSRDKLTALREEAGKRKLEPREVAYVGNDLNDLPAMGWAGVPIAVADAYPEVKAAAVLVSSRPGGAGAVREVIDRILDARKRRGP